MQSEGVWLNSIPYEPAPGNCVKCGAVLMPMHVMILWVDHVPVTPLCSRCFESLSQGDGIVCSLSGSSECGQRSYCVYPDCLGHYRQGEATESKDSLGKDE